MKKQDIYVVIRTFAKDYRKAGKKKKTVLLSQLEEITGYHRKYLTEVLVHVPKSFKKKYPQLVKSLKIFDLSMAEYSRAISSIYEPKTYTSSSTKVKYG